MHPVNLFSILVLCFFRRWFLPSGEWRCRSGREPAVRGRFVRVHFANSQSCSGWFNSLRSFFVLTGRCLNSMTESSALWFRKEPRAETPDPVLPDGATFSHPAPDGCSAVLHSMHDERNRIGTNRVVSAFFSGATSNLSFQLPAVHPA